MVIIGAGGFAKELIQVLISDKYAYNEKNMFFFDDINDIAGELFNRFTMLTSTEQVKQIFQNISPDFCLGIGSPRSEEHTSELQSHSFISYAVFCLKKKK